MTHEISDNLIQSIANYLVKRPYEEVANLIGTLSEEIKQNSIKNDNNNINSDNKEE